MMSTHAFNRLLMTGSVDICLSVLRCNTDTLVLDYATKSPHRVTLEVCEIDHEVIILEMSAHDVVLYPFGIAYRNLVLPVFIHEVYSCNGIIAVLVDDPAVVGYVYLVFVLSLP